jgi:hypothetical protein
MSVYDPARGPADGRGVSSGLLPRLGLAALLLLLLPLAANAYTLVLRSGRHVTLPANFKVTPAAVIYEPSPGLTVTVWLSNVDFAATEKANAEPAGSFAKRIGREPEAGVAAPARAPEVLKTGQSPGRRVVTNKDLEPSRMQREAQEREYERTRRERGMPSKQELRQRVEEQDRQLSEWARQRREARREAELELLRYELLGARRELNELSLRLSQQAATHAPAYAPPYYYPHFYAPPLQVITVFPFGHQRRLGHGGFGRHPHGRHWPGHPWPGRSFRAVVNPSRNAGALPRAPAPAMPGRRR